MEPLKTSIIIIDDHQLFREGVKRILDFEASFDVVAEGDDGSEAMNLVEEYQTRCCHHGYQYAQYKWDRSNTKC